MLSQYFDREEFACKCGCGFDVVDAELLSILIDVRGHFNKKVFINSAARCVVHNLNIGGSETSQHLLGKAADIVVEDIEPTAVYNYLSNKYPDTYGFGKYDTFTHIDSRSHRSRWGI